jgi:FkbM family methyltransferase
MKVLLVCTLTLTLILTIIIIYLYLFNEVTNHYETKLVNIKRLNFHDNQIELYGLEQRLEQCSSYPIFHIGYTKNKLPSDWVILDNCHTSGKIINSRDIPEIIPTLLEGLGKIPEITHLLWLSKDKPYSDVKIPDKYQKYINTWKKHNPEFKIMEWNGENILDLITKEYPFYLNFYNNLTPVISKCDFARFIVVYTYGGLYTDLDFICRKNISSLLQNDSYFLFEPVEHKYMGSKLYNGFFASVQKHPFISGWLESMSVSKSKEVFTRTGPKGLFNYYEKYTGTVFIGNTCDALSILDTNRQSIACSGSYGLYAGTLWNDGSGWSKVKNKAKVNIIKTKNPINDQEFFWEESQFIKNNYPSIDYEISEKKAIYNMALNLQHGYGVIDVGAHIGDLSVPLAKALSDKKRDDITVYAIDPGIEKCDFIEKMSIINSISNISVINCGLSKKYGEFSGIDNNSKNTGATIWKQSTNKNIVRFYPLDTLYDEGKIGPIGLYHIDVEGHEVDTILGSKKVISIFRPIILIEIYIGKGKKCKNKEDCPHITHVMENLDPPYYNSGFMPNGDIIFKPNLDL